MKNFKIGDLWGGLASAAVMLPQAMAFGVALWSQFGGDVATGALAGLIAVAALSLSSGIFAGTCGMVSSPTGPTLVLLGGAMLSLQASGFSADLLPEVLVIILLISGIFQILIGLSNGGRLIKFIPYPVVAGFMSGSALLMILSQLEPAMGTQLNSIIENWSLIPLLTTAITFYAMSFVPRRLPLIPGTVAGLFIGTLFFYLFSWISTSPIENSWVIGQLPGPGSITVGISSDLFMILPWNIIIATSLALAVLASLDTLLTSVVADVTTGKRHNARRELIGQGCGQMVSGMFGGMSGAGSTGATVVAINSGGGFGVAIVTGLVFIFLIILIGPVAAFLPISVLAGIILHVAVTGMLERDILAWLRRSKTRVDGAIALLVTVVTVTYDLMVAVAVGVLIAIFQFVHAQVKAPVIRNRTTVAQRCSLRRRTEAARDLLAKHGERIIRFELQGNLFFGTADGLFEEMTKDLDRPVWIILDMGRVTQVDLSAAKLFQQMASRLESHGGELIFSTVRSGEGLGRKVEKTLRKISPYGKIVAIKTFIDADEALEYAENTLLEKLGEPHHSPEKRFTLAEIEIFKDLSPEELSDVTKVLKKREFSAGDVLFQSGETGDELFIVLSGEIDATLPYGIHHYKRLATFGPGTFFGEVCFLQTGTRTADARVTHKAELYVLEKEGFRQLEKENPSAAIAILTTLGQALSEHLRWADLELQRVID